jgi:hypothetical protein
MKGVLKMRSPSLLALRATVVLTLSLVLAGACVAVAVADDYAPYVAGPVVHGPVYAPYTGTGEEYAPYVAGPVIHVAVYAPYTGTGEEYAPYVAGPVVHAEVPYAPYPLAR